MSELKDFYHILGVDRNAGDMEIKQAYRRLAIRTGPRARPRPDSPASPSRRSTKPTTP
jgi:curved DNA-binding protein CbpA